MGFYMNIPVNGHSPVSSMELVSLLPSTHASINGRNVNTSLPSTERKNDVLVKMQNGLKSSWKSLKSAWQDVKSGEMFMVGKNDGQSKRAFVLSFSANAMLAQKVTDKFNSWQFGKPVAGQSNSLTTIKQATRVLARGAVELGLRLHAVASTIVEVARGIFSAPGQIRDAMKAAKINSNIKNIQGEVEVLKVYKELSTDQKTALDAEEAKFVKNEKFVKISHTLDNKILRLKTLQQKFDVSTPQYTQLENKMKSLGSLRLGLFPANIDEETPGVLEMYKKFFPKENEKEVFAFDQGASSRAYRLDKAFSLLDDKIQGLTKQISETKAQITPTLLPTDKKKIEKQVRDLEEKKSQLEDKKSKLSLAKQETASFTAESKWQIVKIAVKAVLSDAIGASLQGAVLSILGSTLINSRSTKHKPIVALHSVTILGMQVAGHLRHTTSSNDASKDLKTAESRLERAQKERNNLQNV
jgi:hypothetical protein